MGVLIYHEWASLLAMTSATFVIWAALWGIFYRKFFWDMVGGTLGPNGLIPAPNVSFFIAIIVKAPVLQILNIVNGLLTLALEWPLPFIAGTSLHRNFVVRVVFYVWCGFIASLVYQSVDAGLFYAITAMVYGKAIRLTSLHNSRGEKMAGGKAKSNDSAV